MAASSHLLHIQCLSFLSPCLIHKQTELLSCFLWPNYNTASFKTFANEKPRKHLLPFLVFDLSLHDSCTHMWRPACCAADLTFRYIVCCALVLSPCRRLDEGRTCWTGSVWGGRLQRAPLRPRATNETQTECRSLQCRAPREPRHRCLIPDGVSVGQRQAVCLGRWAGPHYHISVIFLRFHAAGSSHPCENQTSRTSLRTRTHTHRASWRGWGGCDCVPWCAFISFPLWMVQIYAYGKIAVSLGHTDTQI